MIGKAMFAIGILAMLGSALYCLSGIVPAMIIHAPPWYIYSSFGGAFVCLAGIILMCREKKS